MCGCLCGVCRVCVGCVWCVWLCGDVSSTGGLKISNHQGGAGISLSSATVRPERTHIFIIGRKEGARKGLGLEPWSMCCHLPGGGHGSSDMVAGVRYGQARPAPSSPPSLAAVAGCLGPRWLPELTYMSTSSPFIELVGHISLSGTLLQRLTDSVSGVIVGEANTPVGA